MFKSVFIQNDEKGYRTSISEMSDQMLPPSDVTVDVVYSTLNYKDGLAVTGKGPIVRSFPMVPGIDFAGVVRRSEHNDFKTGDLVVLNGWGREPLGRAVATR